jgi:putative ABC transport system permease protein
MRTFFSRLKGLLLGSRLDARLDDEVSFHLEMLADEYRRRGMTAGEARAAARREFGGITQMKEAYRERRGLRSIETCFQDARYGIRSLRRTPGFALASLVTLALGIGANTAIFTVVDAVLLRPLPYPEPAQLVVFADADADGQPGNIGYLTLHDYRERATSFVQMSAVRSWAPTLVVDGEAERIPALRVSWNYFEMLGVTPALGRTFTRDEDRPDHWRLLVISDGLWRRRFGADPAAVGRTVRMNDRDYRIVGVLPAGFEPVISRQFFTRAEMWAPLGYDATSDSACRSCQHLRAVGRLGPDATIHSARAELDAIRTDLARTYPTEYDASQVAVVRLQDAVAGPARGVLIALVAAVGLVLLIACANVANLALARSIHRAREMAVRAALGAGRGRLARQLVTESLILSLAGGAAGVALAAASLRSLVALAPASIPRLDQVALDARVLVFALLLSVAAGVLFGLLPAWRAASSAPQRALASESRATAGRASYRARHLLVVGDLALALALLAAAGLMLRSVTHLARVDAGFDPRDVLTLQFSLVGQAWAEDSAVNQFTEQVVDRVHALPGVDAAATTSQVPMGGNYDQRGFRIEGRATNDPSLIPSVERYSVTPNYFRVMRIPLLRGRGFTDVDRADSMPVMVLGESTARQLWPGLDPIGHRVRIGGPDSPWRTVVGIAGDVRHVGLDEAPTLQMYLPQSQMTDSFLVLTVRSAQSPEALMPALRGVIRGLDPTVPVYHAATLREIVNDTMADRRFAMRLLGAFAGLALLLAAVGLYGVVSYTVSQRTREVGVRMALGATPAHVLRLILASGAGTVGAGLASGLVAALVLVRFMESLLFGVDGRDPATLAAAAGALTLVALLAHLIPVRRALRIDPSAALRQD